MIHGFLAEAVARVAGLIVTSAISMSKRLQATDLSRFTLVKGASGYADHLLGDGCKNNMPTVEGHICEHKLRFLVKR